MIFQGNHAQDTFHIFRPRRGGLSQAALACHPLFSGAKARNVQIRLSGARRQGGRAQGREYRSLIFSLPGDKNSGGAIGVDKQRAGDYVAAGALEFYVRGSKGGETVDVGFVQAKGMDERRTWHSRSFCPWLITPGSHPVGQSDHPAEGFSQARQPLASRMSSGAQLGTLIGTGVTEFTVSHEPAQEVP